MKKQPSMFGDEEFEPEAPYVRDPHHAHARRTDPETSHAAAASISPKQLRESQRDVLEVLSKSGPMTDWKLVELMDGRMSHSGIRSRRSELTVLGFVVDTGKRELGPAGKYGNVWGAA